FDLQGGRLMPFAYFGLAALLLISPAPQTKLEVRNIQAAYGPVWPERRTLEYYAGDDSIAFRYDLKGLDPVDGKNLRLVTSMSLSDQAGHVVHEYTRTVDVPIAWGITLVRSFAVLDRIPDLPEGEYTFRA